MAHPNFLVVDGLTGSGKSTLMRALRAHIEQKGHRIFDLQAGTLPTYEEIGDVDVLFTGEPTRHWVGSAIREEMSLRGDYSGRELAHAFSLDRLLLHRRLIIPALEAGKTVLQDRCVSTSIVYQPAMENGPTLEELIELPGNKLALENAPGHLVLTEIDAEKLAARIASRNEESKGVFENVELMRSFQERYCADWCEELFTRHGTTIHRFDVDHAQDETETDFIKLIEQLLPHL